MQNKTIRWGWILGWLLAGVSFAQAVSVDNGLVAYYPFNGNANDESGSLNYGTIYGAIQTADRFSTPNSAYYFDGLDDYIHLEPATNLNFTGPFAISAWIRPFDVAGYGSKMRTIVGKWVDWGPGDVDLRQYALCFGLGGYPLLAVGAGNLNTNVISSQPLAVGGWSHIAGTYDGTTVRVYLNGIEQRVAPVNFAMSSQPVPVLIAASQNGGWGQEYYQGDIDEVRIYNRSLTSNEVYTLASEQAPENPLITAIGFSTTPDGDQDVTTFYTDERIYIRVKDVGLMADDHRSMAVATLTGKAKQGKKTQHRKIALRLLPQDDGSFLGSAALSGFLPGALEVTVVGSRVNIVTLQRNARITLLAPAP